METTKNHFVDILYHKENFTHSLKMMFLRNCVYLYEVMLTCLEHYTKDIRLF